MTGKKGKVIGSLVGGFLFFFSLFNATVSGLGVTEPSSRFFGNLLFVTMVVLFPIFVYLGHLWDKGFRKKLVAVLGITLIFLSFVVPYTITYKIIYTLRGRTTVYVNLKNPPPGNFASVGTISIPSTDGFERNPREIVSGMLGKDLIHSKRYFLSEEIVFETGNEFHHYNLEYEEEEAENFSSICEENQVENFCFYMSGRHFKPRGRSRWFSDKSLELTVLLPENYDLREDILSPLEPQQGEYLDKSRSEEPLVYQDFSGGYGGFYKDNEYSIFTTGTEIEKSLKGTRWSITIIWDRDEFDGYNTVPYLELYCQKED